MHTCARELFEYLYLRTEPLCKADVIIGFGHFDLNIPRHCAALYQQGYAPFIIFTGGIGSGTADLPKPEAQAFYDELQRVAPNISTDAIILEDTSTNTFENIRFTARTVSAAHPPLSFESGISSAILAANAYRQRRVWLTCRKAFPRINFYNAPPPTTFEAEERLFTEKGCDYASLLLGEIERIVRYGAQGDLLQEPISDELYAQYAALVGKQEIPRTSQLSSMAN